MTPVSARGLVLEVGEHLILDGINLNLETGSLTAIVGPNGAGKSTLLRVLAGDIRPTRGEVFIDGRPLTGLKVSDLALLRAFLPQQTRVDFAFSVEEVVKLGRYAHSRHGRKGGQDRTAVQNALSITGIEELAHRSFTTLSIGEQALAMMARVLAQQTPILFLDEPTASLDMKHQHRLLRLLRRRVRGKATIVAVLHDPNLAGLYADRIGLMARGRLHALGSPAEVLESGLLSKVFEHAIEVFDHPAGEGRVVMPSAYPEPWQPQLA